MKRFSLFLMLSAAAVCQAQNDSVSSHRIAGGMTTEQTWALNEIVVTGTRSPVDVRQLPMTVTVIDRETLTRRVSCPQ